MRHIRDRHPNDMPARIISRVILMRIAGIIMIARIRRINGDQGHISQIFAALYPCRALRFGLMHHIFREMIRDIMLVNCNQGHCFWRRGIPQTRHHPCARQSHARFWARLLCFNQFTIFCAAGIIGANLPFFARPLNGHDAPPFRSLPENPQDLAWIGGDSADQATFILIAFSLNFGESRQNAITRAQGRVRGFHNQ